MTYKRLGLVVQSMPYNKNRVIRMRDLSGKRILREFEIAGSPLQTFPLENFHGDLQFQGTSIEEIGAFGVAEDQVTRATIAGFTVDAAGRLHMPIAEARKLALQVGLPIHSTAEPSLVAQSIKRLAQNPKFNSGLDLTIKSSPTEIVFQPAKPILDMWDRSARVDTIVESMCNDALLKCSWTAVFHAWQFLEKNAGIVGYTAQGPTELVKKIGEVTPQLQSLISQLAWSGNTTSIVYGLVKRNSEIVFGSNKASDIANVMNGAGGSGVAGGLTGAEASLALLGALVEIRENYNAVQLSGQTAKPTELAKRVYALIDSVERPGKPTPDIDPFLKDEDGYNYWLIGGGSVLALGAVILMMKSRRRSQLAGMFADLGKVRYRRRKRRKSKARKSSARRRRPVRRRKKGSCLKYKMVFGKRRCVRMGRR